MKQDLPLLLASDMRRHFKQMVELYQHQLYAFACRLTGSQQDAEDIVQEAFVRAYVALASYPRARIEALRLQPWLYRITLNEFHHHVRGARLHVVPMDLTDESPVLAIEGSREEHPETLVESQELLYELEMLVARLPERYRVAVACYYFEHMSYQEISELLDQPLGTVKSTISRGVRQLRSLVDQQQRAGKEA